MSADCTALASAYCRFFARNCFGNFGRKEKHAALVHWGLRKHLVLPIHLCPSRMQVGCLLEGHLAVGDNTGKHCLVLLFLVWVAVVAYETKRHLNDQVKSSHQVHIHPLMEAGDAAFYSANSMDWTCCIVPLMLLRRQLYVDL